MFRPRSSYTTTTVILLLIGAVWILPGCDRHEPATVPGSDLAPRGPEPGRRLPWPEVAEPVRDWSFASDEEEIAIETNGMGGQHSVTVWCVVLEGRLYLATDDSVERKRWVRHLDRDAQARVGIREHTYRVRARPVSEAAEWDAVMAVFARKYGQSIGKYDFPRAGDVSRGRVFELQSRP